MWIAFLHILWATLVVPVVTWNLSSFAPPRASIGQVAVWRNRAFICLPRYDQGPIRATLLEAPWPENFYSTHHLTHQPVGITSHMIPHPYPGSNRTMQLEGHCPSLQNVTALDVDYTRGRLWVLDAGTAICCPKVVVFDLRRNEEVLRVKLTNVTSRTLSSIVADPVVGPWGFQAYVGSPNSGYLLVVWQRGWWQVALDVKGSQEESMHAVGTATLALSRRETLLYLTAPESHFLFSLDLSAVRSSPPPSSKEVRRVTASFLGMKLGPSRGLVSDIWAGLHYFLPRDHAAVRWDTRLPLSAESHAVLLQSRRTLPSVSHMFTDSQCQVWAVVGQHCVKIQNVSSYRSLIHPYPHIRN
ncbi:hypothetical protein Cfor_06333 [Coptotermes formosanus]|uniref:Bee-milk protein n=1 Tax=Coptotermes formosanus TaxID=36987 RepID=A0A6L2PQR9_COPFO|nr:hypothetical protein Cfor_06333 [Coptotermes formosanus]